MRSLPTRFKILGVVYAMLLFAACIYVPMQVSYQFGMEERSALQDPILL